MSTTRPVSASARGPYAKTARRREDIIEAASAIFAANGYHGGSLRDISRQLDLSLTSVLHHFGSKSDLLIAVLDDADHTGADWMPARMRAIGVRDALPELVESNYSRPELLRLFTVLSAEASAPDHPAHEWFVHRYERVATKLARAISEDQSLSRISSMVDADAAARRIVAAWDGLQLQWLLDPSQDMTSQIESVLSRELG
jgi:AcrR family transcriptional regulator